MKHNQILYILLFAIAINTSYSQGTIDTTLDIPKITISEKRIDIPFDGYARHINIISRQDIEEMPATNVNELLQYIGGIDVRRRGINGIQADIGIRGGGFNQVLVMIDGISMSDPQTGHHVMNLPISIDNIAKIEIIKGPAARIYGQNAYSGAINIITKKNIDNKTKLKANTRFSSFNSIDLGLNASIPLVNYSQSISLNTSNSDGYKYNTDYHVKSANYQSVLKLNNNKIRFQSGIIQRKFGANGFYANEKFKDQYEETLTSYMAASTKLIFSDLILKPSISWRRNNDIYLFIRHNPDFYKNEHTSNSYTGELHGQYLTNWGTIGAGLDINNQSLISNNLGNRNRSIYGLFLEHRLQLLKDKLNLTYGLYTQKISDGEFHIHPGIDLSYSLNKNTHIFSSYNEASRIPSYTNLYYSSRAEQGNENLQAEFTKSLELGIRYNQKNIISTISGYYTKNTNLIDWTKDSINQIKWYAANLAEVNILGLDMTNKINIGNLLSSKIPISLNLDYSYIQTNLIDNNKIAISRYTLENLRQQLTAGISLSLFDKLLNINTQYRYYDRVSLDNYSLIDIKTMVKFKSFTIHASINNLLDTKYRETNLVTMPGRWYSIGVSFY